MISPLVNPLAEEDTVADALLKMEEAEVHHLPIVKDGLYLGMLAEADLLDAGAEETMASLDDHWLPFSVLADDHYFSAARLLVGRQLTLVPVTNSDKQYLGSIHNGMLLQKTAQQLGVDEPGALIVLQMNREKYAIGELAKLVETNDAQITQLNTTTDEQTGQLLVTMRISKQEISDIVATLQRYEYQVIYFAGEELYENELRRNYNNLLNFLTM